MRTWFCRLTIAGALVVVSAASLLAQGTGQIAGTVTDSTTGAPLAGAQVAILALKLGAAVDADGHFAIRDVPAGRVAVRAQRIGYEADAEGWQPAPHRHAERPRQHDLAQEDQVDDPDDRGDKKCQRRRRNQASQPHQQQRRPEQGEQHWQHDKPIGEGDRGSLHGSVVRGGGRLRPGLGFGEPHGIGIVGLDGGKDPVGEDDEERKERKADDDRRQDKRLWKMIL